MGSTLDFTESDDGIISIVSSKLRVSRGEYHTDIVLLEIADISINFS